MRDERFLDRAAQIARTSTERFKHGACITHGSRVLAVGVNTHRAHPLTVSDPKTDSAWHAEVAALRSLNTTVQLSKLSLYVARVDKQGNPALSKPCTRCWAVLDYVGITDIHWTE